MNTNPGGIEMVLADHGLHAESLVMWPVVAASLVALVALATVRRRRNDSE